MYIPPVQHKQTPTAQNTRRVASTTSTYRSSDEADGDRRKRERRTRRQTIAFLDRRKRRDRRSRAALQDRKTAKQLPSMDNNEHELNQEESRKGTHIDISA